MKCSHPECTGTHGQGSGQKWAELCPASKAASNERCRRYRAGAQGKAAAHEYNTTRRVRKPKTQAQRDRDAFTKRRRRWIALGFSVEKAEVLATQSHLRAAKVSVNIAPKKIMLKTGREKGATVKISPDWLAS